MRDVQPGDRAVVLCPKPPWLAPGSLPDRTGRLRQTPEGQAVLYDYKLSVVGSEH